LGIHLPGSYTHDTVSTTDKIIAVVDPLTTKVLNKTGSTLARLLEEGILSATTEYGKEYVEQALAVIPATTPALCITDMLHITRGEIKQLHQEIYLGKVIRGLPRSWRK
jgi:hypothetical protein